MDGQCVHRAALAESEIMNVYLEALENDSEARTRIGFWLSHDK